MAAKVDSARLREHGDQMTQRILCNLWMDFTILNKFLPELDTALATQAYPRPRNEVEKRNQHSLSSRPDTRRGCCLAGLNPHLSQLPARQIDPARQESRSPDSSRLSVPAGELCEEDQRQSLRID